MRKAVIVRGRGFEEPRGIAHHPVDPVAEPICRLVPIRRNPVEAPFEWSNPRFVVNATSRRSHA